MKRLLGIVLSIVCLAGCYPQQPQQQQQSVTVQQQDAVPGPVVAPGRNTNVIIDRHFVRPYPYHPYAHPYPPRPYHPVPPPHHYPVPPPHGPVPPPHHGPPLAPQADGVGVHIRAGDTSIGVRTGRR